MYGLLAWFENESFLREELGPLGWSLRYPLIERLRTFMPICDFAISTVQNHFRSIREPIFTPRTGRECSKIYPDIREHELVYKWLLKFDQSTSILELFITFCNSHSRTESDCKHCFCQYRSGTVNSNTVNSKFHFEVFVKSLPDSYHFMFKMNGLFEHS